MKDMTYNENMVLAGAGCSRREFMLGLGVFGLSFGAAGATGINLAPEDKFKGKIEGRKLKIAAIGCGGMGKGATNCLISAGCELVAICDIDPAAFEFWEEKARPHRRLHFHRLHERRKACLCAEASCPHGRGMRIDA